MPTHPLRFIRHFALLAGTLLAFGCFAEPAQPAQTVLAERIDLIRHGESEDNLNEGKIVVRLDGTLMPSKGKVLSGWNSASLTMRGVSQAVKAGEVLLKQEKEVEKNAGDTAGAASPKLRDALWLYSPLLRTKQTLSGVLLGAQLDNEKALKLRPDTRIFERSAGSLTNLTWPEAAQHWPEMAKGRQATVFHQADAAYPNGESLALVYRRASAAIDEAMTQERRIIVISHELTIKTLVAHLTRGKIDDNAFATKVENAKPITLIRRGDRWEIQPAQP